MEKAYPGSKDEYSIHSYLKANLDIARKLVDKDWDMMGVIDGTEGAGKSVLAQQIAKYCDSSFTIDRVAFTPEQFKKSVRSATKTQAVVYDEAYGGLGARGTMTHVNMTIVKMLTEIRAKNLFVFIVLPTFFDLDKYAALWRSRFLAHVYTDEDFNRGHFAFYNAELKKQLYVSGKKTYSYRYPSPNFVGTFPNHYVVDRKLYEAKKQASTMHDVDEKRLLALRTAKEIRQEIANNLVKSDIGLKQNQVSAILGVADMTIHRYLKAQGAN